MIKIIICDDDVQDANITKTCIENVLDNKNMKYSIKIIQDGHNLIEECKNMDFLFLDVELKEKNGIQLAQQLRDLGNNIHIIITSHFQKYLLDGYSIKPDRYLLKPYSQEQFNQIMEPVIHDYLNENRYITDEKIPGFSVRIQDIFYLEYSRKHTYLYLKNRIIKTPYSLSYWIERLHNESFSQCYKSILININKIDYLDKQDVILKNNVKLPISRFYKKKFEQDYIKGMSSCI